MSVAAIRAELARLNQRVENAAVALSAARDAAQHPWTPAVEVLDGLGGYAAAVAYKRREADPAVARALTLDALAEIEERGLAFELIDPDRPAAGLRLVDPSLAAAMFEAQAAARAATADRDRFAQLHAAELRAAENAERVADLRAALDGSDPAAVAAALAGLTGRGPGALTTSDLR